MSYAVLIERQAEKDLRSLPQRVLRRVDARLQALSEEPWPKGALKLKGKEGEGWRVRIGDYRILYTVDASQKSSGSTASDTGGRSIASHEG